MAIPTRRRWTTLVPGMPSTHSTSAVKACVFRVDEVPRPDRPRYPWEKPHQPNMTGTRYAYVPPGSILRGGHRPPATGDYEPWTPEQ